MQLLARDSLRIVHVDDDTTFAELSAHWLRRAGFIQPVVRCPHGLLALQYFSTIEPQSAPHVILLDLHMPFMNGLKFFTGSAKTTARETWRFTFLTSSEDPEHKRQAAVDGVTDYLLKSPQADKLIERLDCLIAINNAQCLKADKKRGCPFRTRQ